MSIDYEKAQRQAKEEAARAFTGLAAARAQAAASPTYADVVRGLTPPASPTPSRRGSIVSTTSTGSSSAQQAAAARLSRGYNSSGSRGHNWVREHQTSRGGGLNPFMQIYAEIQNLLV